MGPLNVALLALGVALLVFGILRARGPYRRLGLLRETQANLARYETWRGGKRSPADDGPSTVELMERELRGQAMRWAAVVLVGLVLVLVGLVLGG